MAAPPVGGGGARGRGPEEWTLSILATRPVQRVVLRGPSAWWAPPGAGVCGGGRRRLPAAGEGGERPRFPSPTAF